MVQRHSDLLQKAGQVVVEASCGQPCTTDKQMSCNVLRVQIFEHNMLWEGSTTAVLSIQVHG